MKKVVALLLALAMVFALCACGNSNSAAPKQDDGEGWLHLPARRELHL